MKQAIPKDGTAKKWYYDAIFNIPLHLFFEIILST